MSLQTKRNFLNFWTPLTLIETKLPCQKFCQGHRKASFCLLSKNTRHYQHIQVTLYFVVSSVVPYTLGHTVTSTTITHIERFSSFSLKTEENHIEAK